MLGRRKNEGNCHQRRWYQQEYAIIKEIERRTFDMIYVWKKLTTACIQPDGIIIVFPSTRSTLKTSSTISPSQVCCNSLPDHLSYAAKFAAVGRMK